jgi:hypothetical protein
VAIVRIAVVSFTLLLVMGCGWAARGIVVIGPDEALCLAPPADGAPWKYAARLDNHFGPRASGVYLGNRYVLTANHIDKDISLVNLNGTNYSVDEMFRPVVFEGTDMRVFRIATDPGLPLLPLVSVAESEFDKPCVMIGYGLGKGMPLANQGWKWGDDRTRKRRWATGTTGAKYYFNPENHISYLETAFDFSAGPTTGQLAMGDSGCGLFENLDGVWKLVGIGAYVEGDERALYDKDLETPGFQPEHSYFAPVHRYVIALKKLVGG